MLFRLLGVISIVTIFFVIACDRDWQQVQIEHKNGQKIDCDNIKIYAGFRTDVICFQNPSFQDKNNVPAKIYLEWNHIKEIKRKN